MGIKSLADGIMLIAITFIGSYLALREFVFEVTKITYKILLVVMECVLMFAAAAAVCDGPWSDETLRNFYSPILEAYGHLLFFMGCLSAVGSVISVVLKKWLRGNPPEPAPAE